MVAYLCLPVGGECWGKEWRAVTVEDTLDDFINEESTDGRWAENLEGLGAARPNPAGNEAYSQTRQYILFKPCFFFFVAVVLFFFCSCYLEHKEF